MKKLLLFCLLALAPLAQAGDLPYDEHADAQAQVRQALAAGKRAHKPTLLIFGANWCGDCRALDASLHTEKNAALIARRFEVVKVDVGNWDRNQDLSHAYGDPIAKGIPAAVVVSPAGKVVYTTQAGELANARKMSDQGIYDFFAKVAAPAQ
ncbi:MAG: thioredoxin family protein [Pseudoxanthomonas sp.]